jgi:cytosine deaminase
VVTLPLVNEWTQDRDHAARRTPRWRGVTLLHELRGCALAGRPPGAWLEPGGADA